VVRPGALTILRPEELYHVEDLLLLRRVQGCQPILQRCTFRPARASRQPDKFHLEQLSELPRLDERETAVLLLKSTTAMMNLNRRFIGDSEIANVILIRQW
jgi:hypothetical protein